MFDVTAMGIVHFMTKVRRQEEVDSRREFGAHVESLSEVVAVRHFEFESDAFLLCFDLQLLHRGVARAIHESSRKSVLFTLLSLMTKSVWEDEEKEEEFSNFRSAGMTMPRTLEATLIGI